MFKFWGSRGQEAPPHRLETPTDTQCTPSVVNSPSSAASFGLSCLSERQNTSSQVPPVEAAGIIDALKDKSDDDLRKLLSDEDAYNTFLASLEPVKTQNKVRDELRNETLQLARENLEKEPKITELRDQCMVIRTTELAAARETLHELERRKEELLKRYSPASLLHGLEEAANKTDGESEDLHKQLLDREIDLATFVQKYKKLRHAYHMYALTRLSAKTSIAG
ncbi:unnamed protein product [Cuscuta campestris]|uniref:VPS37 C-terminal domain-containing protein n=2 Tax=Cuscuta sect. Cleistogrammica TaxID=1824901 RepID=A0A484NM38_9ASTE|nr:hypothetical protein DM860_004368 [Cuscuta australis]VFR02356.1 unnamed protein product [Cuscuta campestris]